MSEESGDSATAAPTAEAPAPVSRWRHRPFIEIVAVAMLSVTAILTAWCGPIHAALRTRLRRLASWRGGRARPVRDVRIRSGLGTEVSAERSAYAEARFTEALDDTERGDNYSLLTVLFALVLFLTAMAQRDIHHLAAWTMLALAGLIALAGFIVLLTFPARF